MTQEHLLIDGHVLHYYQLGAGSKIMLAFHGFGLTGASFLPIADVLTEEYTIYSFDLFYHGKSHWGNPQQQLSKKEWKNFITLFCEQQRIKSFSILAFSLGGKFALTTIEQMPDRIDKVHLLAPDGIQTQIWYNLATYPLVFQKYFRSIIVKPERFYKILKALKSVGLVDKGISKFAASQMNTIKKRRRVYYSWVVFKNLTFNLKAIASTINQHQIITDIFLGKFDKIITEKGTNKLLKELNDYNLHILDCGHNNLITYTADFLSQNK